MYRIVSIGMVIAVLALTVPAFGQDLGGSKLLQVSWEQFSPPGGTGSILFDNPSDLGYSFYAKNPGTYILTVKIFKKTGSDWEIATSDCGTITLSFKHELNFPAGNQRWRTTQPLQTCLSDGIGLRKIVATLKKKGVGIIDQQVSWVIATDID